MKFTNWLFRQFALIEMKCIETHLAGQNEAIDACYDMACYFDMVESREETKAELAAARARYTATFPVGIRFTFENA